ncbi:MAG: hypothetical protein SPI12_01010 [Actinomycetaceae bacterium]|nr:hypothetical protein [Actinomycetaceae bacterium]MDY6082428.1 hypothetical protein [Actinomycetaceae bacterium]
MKLKKAVAAAVLAGALLMSGGTVASAAQTYQPGAAVAAIAQRDQALVDTNKWDRPKVRITKNLELEKKLNAMLPEIDKEIAYLQDETAKAKQYIADATKANAAKEKELEQAIASWNQEVKAFGADMAKYYYKADYDKMMKLQSEVDEQLKKSNALVASENKAIETIAAKLNTVKEDRRKLVNELRDLHRSPCTNLGQCPAKGDTNKDDQKGSTEVKPGGEATPGSEATPGTDAKPGTDTKGEPAKDSGATQKPSEVKPAGTQQAQAVSEKANGGKTQATAAQANNASAKSEKKLAFSGANVGALAGLASLTGLTGVAGVALRRKFN